jgi:hypothetical protein
MNPRRVTKTSLLSQAVDEGLHNRDRSTMPLPFLLGIRQALDAGLSCEQITSVVILMTGLYEALDVFEGEDLVRRASVIASTIRGQREIQDAQRRDEP